MSSSAIYKLQYPFRPPASLRALNLVVVTRLNCAKINQIKQSHSLSKPVSINHPHQTYYDLFPKTLALGPPPSGTFHIDTGALRREFFQLQSLAHPDRHATICKSFSGQESTLINEAFRTLKNPLSRAQYLLSLHGIDVKEDEASNNSVGPELLNEVMDIREAIDEAAPHDIATLKRLKNENEKRIEQSQTLLAKAFDSNDLPRAKFETIRLKFWMSIMSCINDNDLEVPS